MRIAEVTAGQVAQGAEKVGNVAGTVSDVADYAKYGGMALQKGANLVGKGGQLASKAAPLVNIGGKIMKFLPGVGLVAAGADAVRRAAAGDYTGAALGAASGIAGMLPGLGTAASIGLTGLQAARDYANHGTLAPSTDQLAAASGKGAADGFPQASAGDQPTAQAGGASASAGAQPTAQTGASKGDPKVYALQQQLIAKGAKIAADGIMGPQTQAAMKQFGMAEGLKERKMSQREHMKSLMEKLQCIEENPYLMEMIKKDDYLTIAYENLSEEMGYKGARDYILNEFKQIRHILKGFDKLPVREQKIIVDIIEREMSNADYVRMAQRGQGVTPQAGVATAYNSNLGGGDYTAAIAKREAERKAAAAAAAAAPAAGGPSMMDRIKGMGAAGKNMATSAANWAKNNKGKLGLGALGLAGAAGLGMAGKAAYDWWKNKNQPAPLDPMNSPDANLANDPNKGAVKPQPKPPGPKPGGGGQKPAAGGLTPEELAELDAIAGEWENVQDPTIINLLGAYGQVRSKLAAPQAPPAVPGAVANQPGGGQPAPAAAPVAAQGGGAM